MPPHHLFGYNESQAHSHGVHLEILDWRSKSKDELIESLYSKEDLAMRVERTLLSAARKEHQQRQRSVLFRQTGPRQYERYFNASTRFPRMASFFPVKITSTLTYVFVFISLLLELCWLHQELSTFQSRPLIATVPRTGYRGMLTLTTYLN